ncbi:MAG: M20/M25/M40 family metallo-hydrolase [Planctomycetota bacterium]
MRTSLLALLCLAPLVWAEPPIQRGALLDHIKRLSDDAWGGRATGSEGEEKATTYIAEHFESLGLKPAGEDGWFQTVEMPAGHKVGTNTTFEARPTRGDPVPFALQKEFTALSISASGGAEGEAVFAGYGIVAPQRYDDYANLDVRGKVVFVFRRAPRAGGAWNRAMTAHAPFVSKAKRAEERGAIALIVVNTPSAYVRPAGRRGPRDVVQRGAVGADTAKIPVLHMTAAAAERVFPALFGSTAAELEKRIQRRGVQGARPSPVTVAGRGRVKLHAEVSREMLRGRNVCARLVAGSPQRLDGVLVVGAHHDHLGRGRWGSLERDPKRRGEIHNGADDNASGTAGVLEVARYLASKRDELRRDILFLTFTGEERGLVGSRYWCENPTVPLQELIAMINMDMIGRLDGKKLFIGGIGTSPTWEPMLKELLREAGMEADFGVGGRAPSDNTSFYQKNMPVLFFFTGLHDQYHRPDDDWERIDRAGIEKIASLVAQTATRTANQPQRLKFQRADQGGSGPKRAVIGISLGGGGGDEGVPIGSLSPGGAAEKAGLASGDLIVSIDGQATPDVRTLRGILRKMKIGQKIKVEVVRDGEKQAYEVELGGA